jgi:hypothetical protein
MLRRLLLVSVGFVVAAGAGMIFLPLAALTDATIRDAGLTAVFAALLDAADGYDPEDALAAIGFVLWAMGVAVCAAPLAIVALVGEAAGARAYAWYAGGSAVLAAAAPWILRAARGSTRAGEMNAAEGRLALLFFLTGALTGTIYWLIAARGAPSRAS